MANNKGRYYHGTSADNLEAILKNGLLPVPTSKRLWNDSWYGHVYMWCNKTCEGNAFDRAQDSGSVAMVHSKDRRIVVFEIDMPSKYVDTDTSGPNMDEAVQTDKVPVRYITRYWISEDLSILTPFFMVMYYSNANKRIEPTPLEDYVVNLLKTVEGCFIYESPIKWNEVAVSKKFINHEQEMDYIR